MAVWMPVTVVPTSSATWAIDTFITELSSVIRNWLDARVNRTRVAAAPVGATTRPDDVMRTTVTQASRWGTGSKVPRRARAYVGSSSLSLPDAWTVSRSREA